MSRFWLTLTITAVATGPLTCFGGSGDAASTPVAGWLSWRGPSQNGTSSDTSLPDKVEPGGKSELWTYPLRGRGTPVIAGNRVYAFGYAGEGQDLQEVLVCIDADTGKKIWERRFSDFLSDIIYRRYSIGSPTVDPDTGNVYLLTSPGLLVAFSSTGKELWQHSMMEEYGRLTFPNGRTGAPAIDGDLVIVRGITSFWGKQGPGRDRFYAFDKRTGDAIWASTPGVRPTDSSFSHPVFGWLGGKRVFYAGTGCGNIVCINARTGEPLSRFQLLSGGLNSSLLLYKKNIIIAIHGKENLDSTSIGRMVAVKMGAVPEAGKRGPVVVGKDAELWRNPLGIFTSSAVLVGNRVYQVEHTGVLACVDADTGKILWKKKLGNAQLHASPLYADGKLYIPMVYDGFYILRPSDEGAEVLAHVKLAGKCFGSPAAWQGRVYVQTSKKLYCFGSVGEAQEVKDVQDQHTDDTKAVRIHITPAELLLRPGESRRLTLRPVTASGNPARQHRSAKVTWEKYIPAAAKVKSMLNASVNDKNEIVVDKTNVPSAGMMKVTDGELTGFVRGRVLPSLPFTEDLEGFKLTVQHKKEAGVKFAYPPLAWIGARLKWEVREVDGSKVLAKTLDRVLFQRATTFFGHPDMSNYTVAADVMTDGNRRIMSTAGVINQRYFIVLKGNWQQLEVSSNHDRIKKAVPFAWKPRVWYRLKARVDVAADGSGVVRAKAWKRGEAEPKEWLIEVPHKQAHTHGSPGIQGFSPQSKKRVYMDNISVTPNQ